MKKLPLEIDDFGSLSIISQEMVKKLQILYPPSFVSKMEFPIRWNVIRQGFEFEWVVSEMGSITLRLGANLNEQKGQPPLFYLSLGKYENGLFLWEEPDGTPLLNFDNQITEQVDIKINLFIQSESKKI